MSPERAEKREYVSAAKAPLLSYADLIRPKDFVPILEPNEIPVHPDVYKSPLVYTNEFVLEVAETVPDSIRKDVATMQALGINLNVEVTEGEGLVSTYRNGHISFTAFKDFIISIVSGETGLPEVQVEYVPGNATNIALIREGYCKRVFYPDPEYPMPEKKLKAYGHVSGDYDTTLPTWYIHNLSFAGLGGLLYLRNFAIMFNNIGLKKLGNKS